MRPWRERALGLCAAVLLAACAAPVTTQPQPSTGTMGFLALGDSYTVGEAVSASERWPNRLARALRDDGIAVADPQVIATTGWTTDELDAGIDAAKPRSDFDLVSLMIGVNNQYRGRDVDEYRRQFAALLQRAIGFAGGRRDRVFVLSTPDWGVSAFGQDSGRDTAQVAREIDAYNAAARAVCSEAGVAYVDVTTVSRARGAEPAMQADDGLHPSAAMHALWMQAALPLVRGLLAR